MNALPTVNCFTAIGNGFKNYINFSGRTRRSEYWFFISFINFITFFLMLLFILYVTGAVGKKRYYDYYDYYDYYNRYGPYYNNYYYYSKRDYDAILALGIIWGVYVSAIMLPTLSATVRRLHDTGRRGEYIFIGLVPFFGQIALLALLCTDSNRDTNEFGPSPKYTNAVNNYLLVQSPIQNVSAPAVSPLVTPLIQNQVKPVPIPTNMVNNNINNMTNNNINNNNNIIDSKIDVKINDYSNV